MRRPNEDDEDQGIRSGGFGVCDLAGDRVCRFYGDVVLHQAGGPGQDLCDGRDGDGQEQPDVHFLAAAHFFLVGRRRDE